MLQLDVNPCTTLVWFAKSVPFFVGLALYSHLKRKLASVPDHAPAPERNVNDVAEKGLVDHPERALLAAPTATAEDKFSMIWAGVMLPINVAAWYIPNVLWINGPGVVSGAYDFWFHIYLSGIAIQPATAAFKILLYYSSMSNPKLQAQEERYRMLMRCSMLDGVILPPILALVVSYSYFEQFSTSIWMWAGAAAYAAQSVMWAYQFYRSMRYSQSG